MIQFKVSFSGLGDGLKVSTNMESFCDFMLFSFYRNSNSVHIIALAIDKNEKNERKSKTSREWVHILRNISWSSFPTKMIHSSYTHHSERQYAQVTKAHGIFFLNLIDSEFFVCNYCRIFWKCVWAVSCNRWLKP